MNQSRAIDFVDRWRRMKDSIVTLMARTAGALVMFNILLLFGYMLYVIEPLFQPATATPSATVELADQNEAPLHIAFHERGEMALLIYPDGGARLIAVPDGRELGSFELWAAPEGLRSVTAAGNDPDLLLLELGDGSLQQISVNYRVRFQAQERHYRLEVQAGVLIDGAGSPAAVSWNSEQRRLAYTRDGVIVVRDLRTLDSEFLVETQLKPAWLGFSGFNDDLIVLGEDGSYQLSRVGSDEPVFQGQLPGVLQVLDARLLSGGHSLLVLDGSATLHRFLLRPTLDRDPPRAMAAMKVVGTDSAARLVSEPRRKVYGVYQPGHSLSLWHATADRPILTMPVAESGALALSNQGDHLLLAADKGKLHWWNINNPHPEISAGTLFDAHQYETYTAPAQVWQSSASTNDYESKYSLAPLALGTLKAAFYAMLFASPLAICAAIYTAFFMAPALRRVVKPLIEMTEALPTVILGFLAGLWLAPYVEANLAVVMTLIIVLPLAVVLAAWGWSSMPLRVRLLVPEGWHAIVLLPVILLVAWFSVGLSGLLESVFFASDIKFWLQERIGLHYDQRNALIVGVAMGLGVMPTIFSIAEDAIFSVPRHLSSGSLALGATSWQTLVNVVLPTASPGIFSALMIGFGRAIGETMIVLMATGNTPIMDFNLFEGLRSLAATIAIEVPEAEVGSTHYRMLFLAAFVLFVFTFLVNSLAEVVRQRLRARYGAL